MVAPGIDSFSSGPDEAENSSRPGEVPLCKEWPSDNLPRFGGPRPTRPTPPEVAVDWPLGTCYFCHLNVKKGKEGYSIVPSLAGKVFCHKVCGAKARKVRQAQSVSEPPPSKRTHVVPTPLQHASAASAKTSTAPEPESPANAFPPCSPSMSFLPLKKRVAAAAAAAAALDKRGLKRERDSSPPDTFGDSEKGEGPRTAKSSRSDSPQPESALASPSDYHQRHVDGVKSEEDPEALLAVCQAEEALAEEAAAASLANLRHGTHVDHDERPQTSGGLVPENEAAKPDEETGASSGAGLDSMRPESRGTEVLEAPPQHFGGHGIRSKRKPAKTKWGAIAGMLKLDPIQGAMTSAGLGDMAEEEEGEQEAPTKPSGGRASPGRSFDVTGQAGGPPNVPHALSPSPEPPKDADAPEEATEGHPCAEEDDSKAKLEEGPCASQPLVEELQGSANTEPRSTGKLQPLKIVLGGRSRLAKEDQQQPKLVHQNTLSQSRLEVEAASFSSPRLAAAALMKQQQLEQRRQQQPGSIKEGSSRLRPEMPAEDDIHSTYSLVPDSNLNINQCRARLKSWRERACQAEKELAAQSRLASAAEKRVQALELQVERMSREKAAGPSSGSALLQSSTGSHLRGAGANAAKEKELQDLAVVAHRTLEHCGFPKLLPKFLKGASEGNISPSSDSLWWNLVNDTSTNLLRPHSNKFEFSLKTKECLYSIFHAPTGRAAYNILRGEGGVGSSTWDVDGAQYNIPLPSVRTLHQFAKEHPDLAETLLEAGPRVGTSGQVPQSSSALDPAVPGPSGV